MRLTPTTLDWRHAFPRARTHRRRDVGGTAHPPTPSGSAGTIRPLAVAKPSAASADPSGRTGSTRVSCRALAHSSAVGDRRRGFPRRRRMGAPHSRPERSASSAARVDRRRRYPRCRRRESSTTRILGRVRRPRRIGASNSHRTSRASGRGARLAAPRLPETFGLSPHAATVSTASSTFSADVGLL